MADRQERLPVRAPLRCPKCGAQDREAVGYCDDEDIAWRFGCGTEVEWTGEANAVNEQGIECKAFLYDRMMEALRV